MSSEQSLEDRVRLIEQRNARVEADKAWEVSFVRRGSISVLTYLIAASVLFSIGSATPFLGAFIPVVGYIISTLSIPILKNWWLNH